MIFLVNFPEISIEFCIFLYPPFPGSHLANFMKIFLHFCQNAILEVHFVTWEWYSDLVHEIPVILVVLSSEMDGI